MGHGDEIGIKEDELKKLRREERTKMEKMIQELKAENDRLKEDHEKEKGVYEFNLKVFKQTEADLKTCENVVKQLQDLVGKRTSSSRLWRKIKKRLVKGMCFWNRD